MSAGVVLVEGGRRRIMPSSERTPIPSVDEWRQPHTVTSQPEYQDTNQRTVGVIRDTHIAFDSDIAGKGCVH